MEQTIFKVKRDIGRIKKGDKVVVIHVTTCCDYCISIKKIDADIFQKCNDNDLKKLK